jgi:hypothetical protein
MPLVLHKLIHEPAGNVPAGRPPVRAGGRRRQRVLVRLVLKEATSRPKAGHRAKTITPEYNQAREAIRQWRLTAPLDPQREIARKFKAAGINLFSGVVTIEDDCTDPELCMVTQGDFSIEYGASHYGLV